VWSPQADVWRRRASCTLPVLDLDQTIACDLTEPEPIPDFDFAPQRRRWNHAEAGSTLLPTAG
jgi:hypothetical protein